MLAALVGCGDDGNKGTGGSSAEARCARVCERSATAKCDNDSEAECRAECEEAIESTPKACASQLQAVESCTLKAKYECDDQEEATPIGCDKQLTALYACLDDAVGGSDGGTPGTTPPGTDGPGDEDSDACTSCFATSCTAELSVCGPACQEAFTCISDCESQSCETGCIAERPAARTQIQDILQCVADKCADECGDTGTIDLNGDDAPSQPSTQQPASCLPSAVPDGYCDVPGKTVGHECTSKPYPDCVDSPTGASDVYCCSR